MESGYPIPVDSETTVKSRFWTGFAAGMGTTAALVVMAIVIINVFLIWPQLAVNVTVSETARVGEPFVVRLETSNPHDEAVELGNIDIPNRFFEAFEVLSVSPAASTDSPIGGFGSKTWYFHYTVQPGQNRIVELTLQPNKPGSHVLELEVCNRIEDCTMVTRPIEVLEQESP